MGRTDFSVLHHNAHAAGGAHLRTPIFGVMFLASGVGAVSEANYSGDFKTDELLKKTIILQISPRTWTYICPKLK